MPCGREHGLGVRLPGVLAQVLSASGWFGFLIRMCDMADPTSMCHCQGQMNKCKGFFTVHTALSKCIAITIVPFSCQLKLPKSSFNKYF